MPGCSSTDDAPCVAGFNNVTNQKKTCENMIFSSRGCWESFLTASSSVNQI